MSVRATHAKPLDKVTKKALAAELLVYAKHMRNVAPTMLADGERRTTLYWAKRLEAKAKGMIRDAKHQFDKKRG